MAPLTRFDTTGHRSGMVASVPSLGDDLPPGFHPERWSRTTLFAWRAAREAMAHAGLERGKRLGLVVGGTVGGMYETEPSLARLHVDMKTAGSLVEMVMQPLTSTGDRLSEALGPFVKTRAVCSACSSGANALAIGALWLLSGEVDAVVAGGTDAICRLTLSGFNALSATDPEACRPFDSRRKGLNLGEGAGFVVLERASSARGRGVAPLAELAGWAIGAEAHHITNPEPTGAAAARVITRCLRRAGLSPRDVDYVNAHGTATPLNDSMESAGLRLALGDEAGRIPVSSSKGQTGHTLGAAGAIEAIFATLAVKEGVILPTMGLEEPDVLCPLVHVMREARRGRVRAALSDSFGFGGMDTVLLLSEPELGPPHAFTRSRVAITGAAALSPKGLLGSDGALALTLDALSREPAAPSGPLSIDLTPHLDLAKARRLDRPARLGAVVAGVALADAEARGGRLEPAEVGLVLGTAFGCLDPTAAYIHRLLEKGPRFASPAEFPNLVPSSPVGHVSIYHGWKGPTLNTADLGTSAESAIVQAIELLEAGDAEALVAGSIEEASRLIEHILFSLYEGADANAPRPRHARPRSEGASSLVLESEAHLVKRGASPLAWVGPVATWTRTLPEALSPPRDGKPGHVVLAHDTAELRALLERSGWGSTKVTVLAESIGEHEGMGGIALVAACALVRSGVAEVLVAGTTQGGPGRGYAMTLLAPDVSPA
jgi:3-oxoacyl-[acyl-carrier-protein] synthase II